ncbi:MAG: hypothetical protein Terrestrivirus3_138 [Terrestrivirus sp.]|uniref:Macro domain-containing protein n=1 Tax=Terrestrivirus sp. TaxID=2487775 RepID=A0A3G4ZR16_9VIRU|nr:MAG: hypothetical protein Terrestrivirus3_138 [Terrestrivirus sp.]
MTYDEIKGDLFEIIKNKNYALAHCVGNDFIMGAGIAVEFKKRYGQQKLLIESSNGVGTCSKIYDKDENRYIFYLVTKPYSRTSKPTYASMENSLTDMFKQIKELGITKIAMPKIGCGLDGLDWNKVKEIIHKTCPNDVDVLVCYL